MNNEYRLQLRHGAEAKTFSTREDVLVYIKGQLEYAGISLLPYEPVLFFYGKEDEEKKTIIMVGLPGEDKKYFIIDTADLQEKIDALADKDAALEKAINDEIEACKAAVQAEEDARKAADETLQANIDAEADARDAADKTLQDNIDAEATTREEEDKKLQANIDDEKKAREDADAEINDAIAFTKDDLKSIIKACGLIYNEKLSEDRVSYEPDQHNEVIRDAKDIAEAIEKISQFSIALGKSLKINVDDTDTIDLTLTPDEKNGGNVITADVRIAGADGLSKKVHDNNIIGKTTDGMYASVSVEKSAKHPNVLLLKTSGYVDGEFKVDAYETEIPLELYTGDAGKKTGVNVIVDDKEDVISAELNLASDETNILKLEDGEYIVDGVAKNIKYGKTTVAAALTNQGNRLDEIDEAIKDVKAVTVYGGDTETTTVNVTKSAKNDFTVTSDVKLSNDKSIIISNGGLKANVSASWRKGTSTLTIEVGTSSYEIDLSDLAVSVIKKASYDSVTEEIELVFIVGDNEKTLRIPVGTLIHDIEVDDTDTIDLTLKSISGGPNRISAELKVDKAHADNILTVNSNGAYVSGAYVTNAVDAETEKREKADDALKNQISDVEKIANTNKENITAEVERATKVEGELKTAITQEVKDARAAEKANADDIAKHTIEIKANADAISDETARATKAEGVLQTNITAEETRATAAESKISAALDAEIDLRAEKDADLLGKIGDNASKIKENSDAIAQEVKDARAAEKANADAIAAHTTDIKTNADAISAETKFAREAEKELQLHIDGVTKSVENEAAAREKADATVLADAKSYTDTAKSTLETSIGTEASERKAADIVLQSNIDLANKAIEDEAKLREEKDADTLAKAKQYADDIKTEVDSEFVTVKQSIIDGDAKLSQTIADNAKIAKDYTDIETARAKAVEEENARQIKANAEKITAQQTAIETLDGSAVKSVVLTKNEGNELVYTLNVDGTLYTINIPQDQFLENATYDAQTKELVFTFKVSDKKEEVRVNVGDLVDTYTAGNGLQVGNNVFSVKVIGDAQTGKYLTVNENGIGLHGIDEALDAKANSVDVYTKTDVDTKLLDKADNNDLINARNELVAAIAAKANYVDVYQKSDVDMKFSDVARDYATKNNLTEGLATKVNTTEAQATYATIASLNDVKRDYITKNDAATALNLKANADTVYTIDQINDKLNLKADVNALAQKANADTVYTIAQVDDKLNLKVDKTTFDTTVAGKANASEVYAKNEVDTLLNQKANAADLVTAKDELEGKIIRKADYDSVYTKADIIAKFNDYTDTNGMNNKLAEKLNVVDAQNVYATKTLVQEVKDTYETKTHANEVASGLDTRITANKTSIDNFNLTYNPATSELTYTDKNGQQTTHKLYSGSLVKGGEFDTKSNSIVLTIENAGTESKVTIPVSELLSDVVSDIDANADAIKGINEAIAKLSKDWNVTTSQTVTLTKTTTGDKDDLEAEVRIATGTNQAILATADGLFVSKDLKDYDVVFGADGTVSGQTAISKLLESTKESSGSVDGLKVIVERHTEEISEIKETLKDHSKEIEKLKESSSSTTVLETRIEKVENTIEKIEEKIEGFEDRFEKIENSIKEIKDMLENIIDAGTF